MPKYSGLTIQNTFNTIWEKWLNKEGRKASEKAVEVCLNSDYKKEDLLRACDLYVLQNTDKEPEFTYKLSNFINQDHWLDILEDPDTKELEGNRELAEEVIKEWNNTCKSHWCKCASIKARLPIAFKALKNEYFKSHWREALDIAGKIYRYPLREKDHRIKIILSFTWFVSTSNDRHTVLRLMEGEYGKPAKEHHPKKIPEVKQITPEERAELKSLFREVFGEIKRKKEKEKLPFVNRELDTIIKQLTNENKQNMDGDQKESGGDDPFQLF